MRLTFFILIITLTAIMAFGCSGGGGNLAVTPDRPADAKTESASHQLWGLWQFQANPDAGTLDIVPLRTSAMHVNVVPLLEPPAGLKLKISGLHFTDMECPVRPAISLSCR